MDLNFHLFDKLDISGFTFNDFFWFRNSFIAIEKQNK